jgi:rhamnose utilization protein RhaD (predicted bifunctional aldolase and dehydrogenase)
MLLPDDFDDFRTLSAQLGRNPLRVQGPGGNTSIKQGEVMWIKASGTELADATTRNIFVAVDRGRALAEARGEAGDGSCKTSVLDTTQTLRPSIETTFHAALDWPVIAHTHSVTTIAHVITPQGSAVALDKLADLRPVLVPYAKPGLPLTRQIMACAQPKTRVFLLQNHGLIVCGPDVAETATLMEDVEARLHLPARALADTLPQTQPPAGFDWTPDGYFACAPDLSELALAGSYYPDHVVFLGPALPVADHVGKPPAVLIASAGVALRHGATPAQRAMLRCLGDVLVRLPKGWQPQPIGSEAEAELLDWDAEKYRQALAARR